MSNYPMKPERPRAKNLVLFKSYFWRSHRVWLSEQWKNFAVTEMNIPESDFEESIVYWGDL